MMSQIYRYGFGLSLLLLGVMPGSAQTAAPKVGTLWQCDFNSGVAPSCKSFGTGAVTQSLTAEGTIDAYMGAKSKCLTLTADWPTAGAVAQAGVTIGPVDAPNQVPDLAKLTLSFDLQCNVLRPVRVTLASVDKGGQVTGTLTGMVYPPVAGAYYRQSLDLSTMTVGEGKFNPLAGAVQLRLEVNDADGRLDRETKLVLNVDNVSYTAPAYYVSAQGSDKATGRTAQTALATIQKAIDVAGPGDVIMVMDGMYQNTSAGGLVTFAKSGTPAQWIVLRACPGHKPNLVNNGWNAILIKPGGAYIEVRGLTIRGNRPQGTLEAATADGLLKEKDGKPYSGNPAFNGNGVSADGRKAEPAARPHHLRIIGNEVYDHAGGGISGIDADYMTIAGNHVYDNAHWMRYGGSGISLLTQHNFDTVTGTKTFILGNVVRNNRCYVPWAKIGKISDGNGIIIDTNIRKENAVETYQGRLLLANNLCVGNGGGGITVTTSRGVDIANNTLYHNVQSPELAKAGWGDLFVGGPKPGSNDVRIYNNIIWAAPGCAILAAHTTTGMVVGKNICFGDAKGKTSRGDAGDEGNIVADPRFKNPGLGLQADFHLTAESPNVVPEQTSPICPLVDLEGRVRGDKPGVGAYVK